MRPEFVEIIQALQSIHQRMPDLTFGEVLQTVADRRKRTKNACLHDLTDKEYLHALQDYAGTEVAKRTHHEVQTRRMERLRSNEIKELVRRRERVVPQ